MTFRAVLIGLLVSVGLASLGYINDTWLFFSYIGGDLVPTHAFGLVLVALLLVNPLLRLVRAAKFRSSELVVMLALMMMGSVLAGSGLFWAYPHQVITPIQNQRTNPGWEKKDLLHYVPAILMVDRVYDRYAADQGIQRIERDKNWRDTVARSVAPEVLKRLDDEDARLIKGYMTGLSEQGRLLDPRRVPWANWAPALSFWFALLGLNFIAGAAAVVIVHRQWAQREHLAYPIVTFTSELIGQDEGGFFNAIFRQRLFWMGFALAFGVLLVNGYQRWTNALVSIPTRVDFSPFAEYLGALPKVPQNGGNILMFNFYFGAIGLAYFLTSEASFSLGISAWLFAVVFAPLYVAGVDLTVGYLPGGLPAYMYFGAYLGMGVMVLYLGRRFYAAVALRAFGLRERFGDVLPREVWAARILLLSSAAMVVLLVLIGLHWLLAAAFVVLTGLLFLMVGRVHAATGLFMIQPFWHPVAILLAVFGGLATGPHALVILALLCVVVTFDPRIAMVPLALNALKLGDQVRVKPGRLAGWMATAIILSLVISVPFTVWLLYHKGVNGTDSGGTRWALDVARMPFDMLDKNINELDAADQLQAASEPTSLSRLMHARPAQHFLAAAGVGLALVVLCSWLRLRFSRWPLHPVMFLVWGTRWMTEYAPSFLLAWALKEIIMRYGGQRTYHRGRFFFVGLVAGEVAAGLLWATAGVVYYLYKGVQQPSFLVRP